MAAEIRVIYNCNRCGRRLNSWAVDPHEKTTAPSRCPRCDTEENPLSPFTVDQLVEELHRRAQ